jgi:hypothetical protein
MRIRALAIARLAAAAATGGVVAVAIPAAARADAIWCGTFEEGRRPVREAIPAPPPPPPPAVRVRVENVVVDGERDGRTSRRIESDLALERCLGAADVGRGAAWTLDLVVSPDGTVIDARVHGAPGGQRCLTDRARSIQLPRGTELRLVSARVVASAR